MRHQCGPSRRAEASGREMGSLHSFNMPPGELHLNCGCESRTILLSGQNSDRPRSTAGRAIFPGRAARPSSSASYVSSRVAAAELANNHRPKRSSLRENNVGPGRAGPRDCSSSSSGRQLRAGGLRWAPSRSDRERARPSRSQRAPETSYGEKSDNALAAQPPERAQLARRYKLNCFICLIGIGLEKASQRETPRRAVSSCARRLLGASRSCPRIAQELLPKWERDRLQINQTC